MSEAERATAQSWFVLHCWEALDANDIVSAGFDITSKVSQTIVFLI